MQNDVSNPTTFSELLNKFSWGDTFARLGDFLQPLSSLKNEHELFLIYSNLSIFNAAVYKIIHVLREHAIDIAKYKNCDGSYNSELLQLHTTLHTTVQTSERKNIYEKLKKFDCISFNSSLEMIYSNFGDFFCAGSSKNDYNSFISRMCQRYWIYDREVVDDELFNAFSMFNSSAKQLTANTGQQWACFQEAMVPVVFSFINKLTNQQSTTIDNKD